MERDEDRADGTERMTVQEAAARLQVGEQAIRKRVKRGTIEFDRELDGRVYVYLPRHGTERDADRSTARDTGTAAESASQPGYSEMVEALQDQVQYLRSELEAEKEARRREVEAEREARRRADHIIAALTERIPELEAPPQSPQEAQEAAESASEGESGEEASGEPTEAQSAAEQPRVPWWRRIFGLGS